jgi:hypothetical protein
MTSMINCRSIHTTLHHSGGAQACIVLARPNRICGYLVLSLSPACSRLSPGRNADTVAHPGAATAFGPRFDGPAN